MAKVAVQVRLPDPASAYRLTGFAIGDRFVPLEQFVLLHPGDDLFIELAPTLGTLELPPLTGPIYGASNG